jgi:superfamily I DNA/RNA helicase
MSRPVWSPQQLAIFDWVKKGRGNAFVEAVAGAGKTTTLVEVCALLQGQSAAFAAFNKNIADEIGERVRARGCSRVFTGTFHKFGLAIWRGTYPKVQAGPEAAKEKSKLVNTKLNTPKNLVSVLDNLVGQAKQRGIGTPGLPIEDAALWLAIIEHFGIDEDLPASVNVDTVIERAMAALRLHVEMKELLDFNDMVYMPVHDDMRGFQNDWLMVDECQDLNGSRRMLARQMLRPGGRAIFVGDRFQAIFGFNGADADAVNQLTADFNCARLPLTITYRCPKKVVEQAQAYVPHIEAAKSAPEGKVSVISQAELYKTQFVPGEDAVLCRNTRPLVRLAYILIGRGVPAYVEGRDIGKGLLKLVARFDQPSSLNAMLVRLSAYLSQETVKLRAANKEMQAAALEDRVETLEAIAEECTTVGGLKDRITSLFEDGDRALGQRPVLSTVHKAKGREWSRVFVLGYDLYMPSCYATKDWEKEQENNLVYVAYTRAKRELVLVEGERKNGHGENLRKVNH